MDSPSCLTFCIEIITYFRRFRKAGRNCKMKWDSSKTNGKLRKLCDVTLFNALARKDKVEFRKA